jgi:hypothetical protein
MAQRKRSLDKIEAEPAIKRPQAQLCAVFCCVLNDRGTDGGLLLTASRRVLPAIFGSGSFVCMRVSARLASACQPDANQPTESVRDRRCVFTRFSLRRSNHSWLVSYALWLYHHARHVLWGQQALVLQCTLRRLRHSVRIFLPYTCPMSVCHVEPAVMQWRNSVGHKRRRLLRWLWHRAHKAFIAHVPVATTYL